MPIPTRLLVLGMAHEDGTILASEVYPVAEACQQSPDQVRSCFRRLEARGEIRGGRFIAGFTGEQYAAPEALGLLRDMRRKPNSQVYVSLSAADPLNLADRLDGLHLADGDELDRGGIALRAIASPGNALEDRAKAGSYPHGVLRPASASSASVSTIGSPTTLEKLPSMRSMKAPARPWIP